MANADYSQERDLIRRYLDGDLSSLQKLIKKYEKRIYSYIFMLVKDAQLADDIFQDTFIKVINTLKSGTYKEEGKFIQWAMRIAHNLVIDHFRKNKKVNFLENRYDESDIFDNLFIAEDSVEQKMVKEQILKDVKKLMEMLPNDQKEVLYLRCYAQLSFKEIAEQTNVSINTALGRMRYALINLRKLIEEKNLTLSA
jgi:RNA polymerase sigma-70 factor (ECF subfamily)